MLNPVINPAFNPAIPSKSPMDALTLWQPERQQRLFRLLVQAFSFPGRTVPSPEACPLAAAAATLLDAQTSFADPHRLLSPLFVQRLASQAVSADQAAYVVYPGALAPDFTPCVGTLESPERGATVMLTVASLTTGRGYRLSGPGIQDEQRLLVDGLHPDWLQMLQQGREYFPMGVDLLLISDDAWVALPRTVRLIEETV